MQTSITNMNLYMLSNYTYQGETLVSIFAEGAFLDLRNIPVLNDDLSMPIVTAAELQTFFKNLIIASVVCFMFTFFLYKLYLDPFHVRSYSSLLRYPYR